MVHYILHLDISTSETFERQIHDSTIKLSPLIHIY